MSDTGSEWTVLPTADWPMRVFVTRPSRLVNRAVVVLQEAFGVNEHIQEVSQRLAQHGYLAATPDLFRRTGPEVDPYDDHAQAMALIGTLGGASRSPSTSTRPSTLTVRKALTSVGNSGNRDGMSRPSAYQSVRVATATECRGSWILGPPPAPRPGAGQRCQPGQIDL